MADNGPHLFSIKAADTTFAFAAPHRAMVRFCATLFKPYLDRITDDYVGEAIARNHAEDNPELKAMLTEEIRSRPDGPGRNLDVIDAIPHGITRSVSGVTLAVVGNIIDSKVHTNRSYAFKWLSIGSAATIILTQGIEMMRSVCRFMSGMQGSEELALHKYHERHGQAEAPTAHVDPSEPQETGSKRGFTDKLVRMKAASTQLGFQ